MPTLTEQQTLAARKLVTGMSQGQVAKDVGVSRKTINRWAQDDDFQAEMAVLRRRLTQPTENAIAQLELVTDDEAQEWLAEVDSHLESLKQAAKTARVGGMAAATKAMRRLKDIPDEALKPGDAVALLKAGTELLRASFDFEAEALGLYALAERVREDAKE